MRPASSRSATRRQDRRRRIAILLLSGFLPFGLAEAGAAVAQMPVVARPSPDPLADHVAAAARRFNIPEAWIRAVMRHESGGDPRAVSPKGAMGLMQVMPATWVSLSSRHALGSDPFDPRANILAGTAFLRSMYDRYGTVPAMLAAYSAGPARADQWLSGRPLPPETRAYLAAVAPAIEGGAAATAPVAPPPDPLAWIRAPLFVGRPKPSQPADGVQPERGMAGVRVEAGARDGSALVSRPSGLFVARRGDGEVR